jgi:hypothetical protein
MTEGSENPLMTEKPVCDLTKHWNESQNGVHVARYMGADGVLYEEVTHELGKTFWQSVTP